MSFNKIVLIWKVGKFIAKATLFPLYLKVKGMLTPEDEPTVQCDMCLARFPAINDRAQQGERCATFASHFHILGGYGSCDHDGDLFDWCTPVPLVEKGKVELFCDDCVNDLSMSGMIQLRKQGVYFGIESVDSNSGNEDN